MVIPGNGLMMTARAVSLHLKHKRAAATPYATYDTPHPLTEKDNVSAHVSVLNTNTTIQCLHVYVLKRCPFMCMCMKGLLQSILTTLQYPLDTVIKQHRTTAVQTRSTSPSIK
jgi:hypothetical protein